MLSSVSLLFEALATLYCSSGKHSLNKMMILLVCLHFEHALATATQRAYDFFFFWLA